MFGYEPASLLCLPANPESGYARRMNSELAPAFVIPLDSAPAGGLSETGLQFAGSPPALFIAEPAWDPSWSSWFWWHAPDIAAVGLFLALAVSVLAAAGLRRNARVSGALHCRSCGHELTEPQVAVDARGAGRWASAEAKCPECGKRDERGPERGGGRHTKRIAVLVIGAVVCIVCAVTLLQTLRAGGSVGAGNETWPIAGLERVLGSWALKRRQYAMPFEAYRFLRVDPLTRARTAFGTVDTTMPHLMTFVTPDARYVLASARRDGVLVVIDTQTKRQVEAMLGASVPGFRGYLTVVSFSKDSKRVYVACLARNDAMRRDELFAVELATGAARSIGVVEYEARPEKNRTMSFSRFLIAEAGEDVAWVHEVAMGGGASLSEGVVLRWGSIESRRERTEEAQGDTLRVWLSEDGKLCVVESELNGKPSAFALADGKDVEDVPARPHEPHEAQQRFMIMPEHNGSAQVCDRGVFSLPRATLKVTSSRYVQFERSQGDRFVAAVGERQVERNWISQILGVPALKGWEVRVWDLQPLLDQQFGEKRSVPAKK